MRTYVTFRHPAEFVPVSEEDGILGTDGAKWFVNILRQIPNVLNDELCQEDWGVAVHTKRNNKRFWIGLSPWLSDDTSTWVAHVHLGPFAWWQKMSLSGKNEFNRLVLDFHEALLREPAISEIMWYHKDEMQRAHSKGTPAPDDGK